MSEAQEPYRVIVVDDSAVIRGFLVRALESDPDLSIVATAATGSMALRYATQHQPDVIVLDIEMPEMDGLTALPELIKNAPKSKIIMASTLTKENAAVSVRALSMGASDYIEKPSSRGSQEALDRFNRELLMKVKTLAEAGRRKSIYIRKPSSHITGDEGEGGITSLSPNAMDILKSAQQSTAAAGQVPADNTLSMRDKTREAVSALAIASSTGGPQALAQFFEGLKQKCMDIPIFVTQHMPPTFTTFLAQHLSTVADRPCTEGVHDEIAKPGHVYIAPGDYHMEIHKQGDDIVIKLNQKPQENFCRPAADPMLRTLASTYGKSLLCMVLTGMGQDGLKGSESVVQAGGSVIAQDEETSVVWGMPGAVATNGLCSALLPLEKLAPYVAEMKRGM